MEPNVEKTDFKRVLRYYLFEGDSVSSKIFDILILILVLVSVTCVILEEIPSIKQEYGTLLIIFEWIFTIFFTIEYSLRAYSAQNTRKYVFSFFGIIDLISVLPLYISIFLKGEQVLQVLRLLRLIRIFSRLLRASGSMNKLSNSFLHLKEHLAPNEHVLLFFRPSRKKMLFRYFLILFFMILSTLDIAFNFVSKSILFNIPFIFFFSIFVLCFSFFMLLKTEYSIWSERYMITNERIFHSKGIFHENLLSRNYQYITDISLHQKLSDKILNTGDLVIHIAGGEGEELNITGVSNPLAIKKLINESMAKK